MIPKFKVQNLEPQPQPQPESKRRKTLGELGKASEKMKQKSLVLTPLIFLSILIIPIVPTGQEINPKGWVVPDLRGLSPYSITIQEVNGAEKIVEKFFTPEGGHIARVSGNGKVFAYIVDMDQKPPIDYFLIDPNGSGRFTPLESPAACSGMKVISLWERTRGLMPRVSLSVRRPKVF